MTTATEPVSETTVAVAPTEGVQTTEVDTPAVTNGARAFDPEALPAEIKGYVSKQREEAQAEARKQFADYEKHRAAAQEWEGVRNDPRFQQWADSLRRQEPQKFDVSDEAFAAVLSGDKAAFVSAVQQAAKHMLEQTVTPQLESVRQHNEFQAKVGELQQTVAKFPDFKELDKRGLIEPIIRKYPMLSFEDAYWLAKKDTLNEEADRRARGIVLGKKTATLERPGTSSGGRSQKVSAKNREEAMLMVAEAVRAGRPVPEFDEIGD